MGRWYVAVFVALAACIAVSDSGPGPGGLTCASTSASLVGNGCRVTFSQCTDMHSYGVSCSSGTCSCELDGSATGMTFSSTADFCSDSSSAKAAGNQHCGFTVQ